MLQTCCTEGREETPAKEKNSNDTSSSKVEESNEPKIGHEKYNVVYDQSTPEIYDQWSKDGYDTDVAQNSIAVENLVMKYLSINKTTSLKILDAGCGTGRVGEVIVREVLKNNAVTIDTIDGADYSQGMLDVAKSKGCYSNLTKIDLTKPFDGTQFPDNTYDAMLCSGVFLQGHVGAEAIPELSRVVKSGGLLCFTVRPAFWEKTKTEWEKALEKSNVDILEVAMLDYADNFKAPMLMCKKR